MLCFFEQQFNKEMELIVDYRLGLDIGTSSVALAAFSLDANQLKNLSLETLPTTNV